MSFAQEGRDFKNHQKRFQQMDGTKIGPIITPKSEGFTVEVEGEGSHVRIFEEPSSNCSNNVKTCKFYYTPFFYFEKASNGKIAVNYDNSTYAHNGIITVYLMFINQGVEDVVLNYVNKRYKKTFSRVNLEPTPVGAIYVDPMYQLLDDTMYSQDISARFPNLEGDDNVFVSPLYGLRIPIQFEVPRSEARSLVEKIQNGVEFNVRYAYANQTYNRNKQSTSASVQLSDKTKRELMGGRRTVYASKTQLLEALYESMQNYSEFNYLEDEKFMEIFQRYSQKFLDTFTSNEKSLGDLYLSQISEYRLSDNDPLFSLSYVTNHSSQMNESETSHQIMSEVHERYKKGNWNGKAKILKIGFGGSKSSESNHKDTSNYENKTIREISNSENWQGTEYKPLDIKLYEISTQTMSKTLNVNIEYVIAGDQSVSFVTMQRNSRVHLSNF
jgi:hypothetical protein